MVNVYDCYFTNNVAQEGGALLASQYTWNCLMEDNVSRSNGGAFRNGTSFTVRLAPGTYDVSECAMNANGCLYVAKGITLEGTDGTSWRVTPDRNAKVILDAKYAMPVITLAPGKTSNFRIKHVTIQNGTNTSHGAGICNGFYTGNFVTCTNCVYRTDPGWSSYTLHPTDCVMTNDLSKLFLQPGEADYDPANPYRLRYGSPAKDAGFSIDWPEGATDLAGNPRICTKYGRPLVDIGCYECWIPQLGTWLFFR